MASGQHGDAADSKKPQPAKKGAIFAFARPHYKLNVPTGDENHARLWSNKERFYVQFEGLPQEQPIILALRNSAENFPDESGRPRINNPEIKELKDVPPDYLVAQANVLGPDGRINRPGWLAAFESLPRHGNIKEFVPTTHGDKGWL